MIKSSTVSWTGYVAKMEESNNAFKMLTDKPTKLRSQRRITLRCEENIIIDFEEVVANRTNWIVSAQDRDYCRSVPWAIE